MAWLVNNKVARCPFCSGILTHAVARITIDCVACGLTFKGDDVIDMNRGAFKLSSPWEPPLCPASLIADLEEGDRAVGQIMADQAFKSKLYEGQNMGWEEYNEIIEYYRGGPNNKT